MNIIFLDIDGVLNSKNKLMAEYKKTGKPYSGYSCPFDEECMKNLQRLVRETKAEIVITSTWRKDNEGKKVLLGEFEKYGLDKAVIGYTPILPNKTRGKEIEEYLSTLRNSPNFIILDDSTDMEELLPFLIKTDMQTGLTNENVREAMDRLNIAKSKPTEEVERE